MPVSHSDKTKIERLPLLTLLLTLILLIGAGCNQNDAAYAPVSSFARRQPPQQQNKRGVHLLMIDTFRDWPTNRWREHMLAAREAVGAGGYVTQLIRYDDLDAVRWQQFMDLCKELELTPIIRIANVANAEIGGWDAPISEADPKGEQFADTFATFLAALDWPTDVHIVIVGNEPNHGPEWGGMPQPAEYARFLVAMADALHVADPQAFVLNAGFDHYAPHTNGQPFVGGPPLMDATSFIDEMISAEPNILTYIDGWASHPYPVGAFIEPPWVQQFGIDYVNQFRDESNNFCAVCEPNRGINGYAYELQLLADRGVTELPVFITETGWQPDVPNAAIYFDLALRGNGGRYPDLPEEGWTPWEPDDRVVAITPFAFNGDPARWDKFNWLELSDDGEILGTRDVYDLWGQP